MRLILDGQSIQCNDHALLALLAISVCWIATDISDKINNSYILVGVLQ